MRIFVSFGRHGRFIGILIVGQSAAIKSVAYLYEYRFYTLNAPFVCILTKKYEGKEWTTRDVTNSRSEMDRWPRLSLHGCVRVVQHRDRPFLIIDPLPARLLLLYVGIIRYFLIRDGDVLRPYISVCVCVCINIKCYGEVEKERGPGDEWTDQGKMSHSWLLRDKLSDRVSRGRLDAFSTPSLALFLP